MSTRSQASIRSQYLRVAVSDAVCWPVQPDLEKFKMEGLDKDIVALMKKRVHDMAGCTVSSTISEVNVYSSRKHCMRKFLWLGITLAFIYS